MEASWEFLRAIMKLVDLASRRQSTSQSSNRFGSLSDDTGIGASSSDEDRSTATSGESGCLSVQMVTLESSEQETSGYHSLNDKTPTKQQQVLLPGGSNVNNFKTPIPCTSTLNDLSKSRGERRRKCRHIFRRARSKAIKSVRRRGSSLRNNDTNKASGESPSISLQKNGTTSHSLSSRSNLKFSPSRIRRVLCVSPSSPMQRLRTSRVATPKLTPNPTSQSKTPTRKTRSLGSNLTPGMTDRLSSLPLPVQFKELDQMQWSDRRELIRKALQERSLTKLRPLIMALEMSKTWMKKSNRARPIYICMENDHGCFKAMKIGQPRLVTYDNLITHWLSVHFAGELLYSCSECGKRFKYKSSIAEHKKIYHGAD